MTQMLETIERFQKKIKINNTIRLEIPNGPVELKAFERDLRKITVLLPSSENYQGEIKATILLGKYEFLPWEIIRHKDGTSYLDVGFEKAIIQFEVPGYSNIRFGPFENTEKIPKEFIIQLKEGEKLKLKVVDDQENKPVTCAKVEVKFENKLISALPTNQQGEVTIGHLKGQYYVYVNVYGFVPFNIKVDTNETKEIFIKLVKCGRLKGKLKNPKSNAEILVILKIVVATATTS